jgi:hypothetical protein
MPKTRGSPDGFTIAVLRLMDNLGSNTQVDNLAGLLAMRISHRGCIDVCLERVAAGRKFGAGCTIQTREKILGSLW